MAFQAKGLLRMCISLYSCRSKSMVNKQKAFSFNRKTRFIAKLLAENATERKQWSKGLPTHKVYGSSSLSTKRLETLNRLYLANITDGLTRSTRCTELADLGLMVNRVELSQCGQSLKVFWSSCSLEADKHVANILEDCREEMRDNIVTKSVGGFVPFIIFTKDVNVTMARDIEHILSLPAVVKDLETELPKEENNKGEEENVDRFTVEISTNILGFKRADVLRRVIATAKRLRKAERRLKEEEERNNVSDEVPERVANIDLRQQKSAISAYMRKQKKIDKDLFINSLEKIRLKKDNFEELCGSYADYNGGDEGVEVVKGYEDYENYDYDDDDYDDDNDYGDKECLNSQNLEEDNFGESNLEGSEKRPT